jgi:hypothetical protein
MKTKAEESKRDEGRQKDIEKKTEKSKQKEREKMQNSKMISWMGFEKLNLIGEENIRTRANGILPEFNVESGYRHSPLVCSRNHGIRVLTIQITFSFLFSQNFDSQLMGYRNEICRKPFRGNALQERVSTVQQHPGSQGIGGEGFKKWRSCV